MEITNNIHSEVSQRKLSIQVALNGLSFCSYHSTNSEIIDFEQLKISPKTSSYDWEENLKLFLLKNKSLISNFEKVTVFHHSPYFTWVPSHLFIPENAGSYLQFSSKVYDTDLFAFDTLNAIDATFVYIPLTHLNNLLLDFYPTFEYYHCSYHWLQKIIEVNDLQIQNVCVLIEEHTIEIAVFNGKNLMLHNQFEVKNATDVLYYVLFCFEQLHLNTEQTPVFLMGNLEKDDQIWQLLYEYIRDVQMHSLQNNFTNNQMPFSLVQ
jgi:hypothetical protein